MKKILLTATILASFASASFAAEPVVPAKSQANNDMQKAVPVTPVESKSVVTLTKEQVAAIDAKCKKDHANVMSPEYKACVATETKNASEPKVEAEGQGSPVAPTEAPAAAPVAPTAPVKK